MKFILKIIVSIAILAYLFWRVDMQLFLDSLSHTSPVLFLKACLILFILLILPALSQKLLFKSCQLNLSFLSIYDINLKSMFYSLVIPGDIAAGVARLFKFSKAHRGPRPSEGKIKSAVLVVMAADRFLNMGSLILPLAPLLFLAPLPDKTVWFQKIGLITSLCYLTLLFLGYKCRWDKIFSFIFKKWNRVSSWLLMTVRHFQDIPEKILLTSFSITFSYQFLMVILVDITLAKSLGLNLPWIEFISLAAAIRFLRYIPVTLSGIGIREGLYPFFLQFYGVPIEQAFTLGILGTVLVLISGLVGGTLEGIEFFQRKTKK